MNQFDSIYPHTGEQVVTTQNSLLRQVYAWMGGGLLVTSLMAFFTLSTPALLNAVFSSRLLFFGLIIGEIALVVAISGAINRISAATATFLFLVYSALNGVTLSALFIIYTNSSIVSTFLITAGMFGAMSAYGYLTKRDLTAWGSFLFMGLIGIIIASVVNIFLKNNTANWIVSAIGVIVFTGLTAYDTWKIKEMAAGGAGGRKPAVLGALTLYLSFLCFSGSPAGGDRKTDAQSNRWHCFNGREPGNRFRKSP
jgi:FtsH-binding integral membrane protein